MDRFSRVFPFSARCARAAVGLALASVLPMGASAAPSAVPFLGQLLVADGVGYDGLATIRARIHATAEGEAPVWPTPGAQPVFAEFADVQVDEGVFTVVLGGAESTPAEALDWAVLPPDGAWLELEVNGELLAPRLAMLSVPYALHAQNADRVGGLEAAELVTTADLPDLSGLVAAADLAAVAFSGDYSDLLNVPPPATGVTSVDGLAGGEITSSVTVAGSVDAQSLSAQAITQAGQVVCDASGNCGPSLAQLGCQAGETVVFNGASWGCQPWAAPTAPCQGPHSALQWTGTQYVCGTIDLQVASGGNVKGYEIVDSWGYTWDGVLRSAAPWAEANARCLSLGGRLPTASELYRVSAVHSDELADPNAAQWHWTRTPWSLTEHTGVRLTDGATDGRTSTSSESYRCVWPSYALDHFAGNHCMGPAGAECWTATPGDGSVHMDVWDRPAVPYLGAQDECLFYHAHLPYEQQWASEITQGLPNGSNEWMWTPDTAGSSNLNIVRWSDTDAAYSDTTGTYTSYSARTSARRFRCIGRSANEGTYPNPVAGSAAIASTRLVADAADRSPAVWAEAITDCFAQGGHVPSDRDLVELVRGGLPNGSNQYLWGSEAYTSTSNVISRWTGVYPEFGGSSGERTGLSRSSATGAAYRCVYYPLDAAFSAPTECNFVCFESQKGGPQPTRMHVDALDRVPSSFIDAVKTCRDIGGRLATLRDITEAVRDGLGNGSNAWIWTSDQITESSSAGNYVVQTRWLGTDTAYSGATSTYVRFRYKTVTELAAFRCVWTNEIE